MKKFLIAIPALALVLTACGSTGYDDYEDDYSEEYVPVCIDPETEERLPDSYCSEVEANDDGSFLMGALLVYMLASDYPGVGHKAKHYHKTKPKGAVLTKPVKKGYDKPKVTTKKHSTNKPKSSGGGFKPKSSGGGFSGGGKRR